MAQCQALTRSGQPCRNEALPGSNYCRVHQRKPSAPIIPVILGGDLLRVEYLGRGFFRAFNHEFTPEMRERVLPAEEARFLVANFPKLFRIRE